MNGTAGNGTANGHSAPSAEAGDFQHPMDAEEVRCLQHMPALHCALKPQSPTRFRLRSLRARMILAFGASGGLRRGVCRAVRSMMHPVPPSM